MAVVGSSLYMVGGYQSSARSEMFVYDTRAGYWSNGPAMVRFQCQHCTTSVLTGANFARTPCFCVNM